MGLMKQLIGGQPGVSTDDYVEIDADEFGDVAAMPAMHVHIAEVNDRQDVISIKDAVYDGDLVIADITRLRTEDRTVEHIIDELRQVAGEVSGDIVQKGDDQLIITPAGVRISRQKLD